MLLGETAPEHAKMRALDVRMDNMFVGLIPFETAAQSVLKLRIAMCIGGLKV